MSDKDSGPNSSPEPTETEPIVGSKEIGDVAAKAAPRLSAWRKVRLVVKVIEVRLRFIAILVAVCLFIGYWDTVKNYWDKWTRPQSAVAHQLGAGQEFFCPMDPQVVRSTYEPNGDVPNCPICGMPLSIRKKGEKEALPPGVTGRVQLTPERIHLAGVKTVPVGLRPISKQTVTVGYVAFDESRLSQVVARVAGYVEKLYVDKTYVKVKAGEPLAELYSPELYSTAQELVLAAQNRNMADLTASARDRLLLWGVGQQEIDGILASGKPSSRLVIRSPQSGYVIEKKIVVGSSVEPGMTLLEVADLSGVWIEAEVYEKDISFLQVGQKIEAAVEAYPHSTFTGKLALIYPRLEAATRTNRVRFELDNLQHELRPGMFATVMINTPLETIEPFRSAAVKREHVALAASGGANEPITSEFLVVPERAVIDTGAKKVVYVEREPGLFEGLEVELGPRVELPEAGRTVDYYPVVKGLMPGDRVADAGAFLIDAETRLNPAAASSYFGASGGPQSGGARDGVSSGHGVRQDPDVPDAEDRPASTTEEPSPEDLENLAKLPEEDRQLARQQRICPITGDPLGSMGVPPKIMLRGRPVFLCCKGCAGAAKKAPEETLKKVDRSRSTKSP
jgi:Cu(I)/Ag(I) efflux system membrane fusion protein